MWNLDRCPFDSDSTGMRYLTFLLQHLSPHIELRSDVIPETQTVKSGSSVVISNYVSKASMGYLVLCDIFNVLTMHLHYLKLTDIWPCISLYLFLLSFIFFMLYARLHYKFSLREVLTAYLNSLIIIYMDISFS